MFIIFIRSVIIFITLFLVMRLMGKRQIGEMQPFELVITLVIADLACIPMANISIPLLYGIVAIVALFILHQLMTLIAQSGLLARRVISGKPTVVINRNGVDFLELKRNNLDVSDLIEAMRTRGMFSLDHAEYALFEANGRFSAMPSESFEDSKPSLPMLFISNGRPNTKNLELVHISLDFLKGMIIENGGGGLKNIGVLTIDSNGKVYMQARGQKFKTFNITLPQEAKW